MYVCSQAIQYQLYVQFSLMQRFRISSKRRNGLSNRCWCGSFAKFSSFWNEEVEFHLGDSFRDPSNKRRRTLPGLADGQTLLDASLSHRVFFSTQNSTTVSAESKFRTGFYYCLLDLLLRELKRRFSIESCDVLVQFSLQRFGVMIINIEKVRDLSRR
jgi:hypothetical protein